VASASNQVIVPELGQSPEQELDNLIAHIELVKQRSGHSSYIVVVTENQWPEGITELTKIIHQKTQVETRPVILGHVQRGGSPVAQDRLLATKLGAYAVELLRAGETLKMVGEINHQLIASPLTNSWRKKKKLDPYLIKIQQELINPCL
jgi:6-phosphofructokinase 1